VRGRLLVGVAVTVMVLPGARAVGQCTPLFEARFETTGGWHVTSISDVDGDGVRDLVIGRAAYPRDERPSVLSGATGDWLFRIELDHAVDFDAKGQALLSRAVEVGDINGDDITDILIGIAFSVQERPGEAVVFSGADGEPLRFMVGTQADDLFGRVVATLGDMDGDGAGDYAIAAPGHDTGDLANIGRVVIYSGASGAALRGLYGTERGERFGSALAGGFDWDGDGTPDLAVGAPAASDAVGSRAGRVHLFSGADFSRLINLDGAQPLESFGSQLAVLAPDSAFPSGRLLISGPSAGLDGALTGRVAVYDVATHEVLAEISGDVPGDRFGLAVADAGDVEGDGVRDIIVGSAVSKTGIINSGRIWIFSGADYRLLRRWHREREQLAWFFGRSVEGLHQDFDGDGLEDVLIGRSPSYRDGVYHLDWGSKVLIFDVGYPLAGDVNRDGHVDQRDLGILLATYELPPDDPQFSPEADVNGDGLVNQQDLGLLLSQYGQGCD
jgi:Dockerin type I domain/FG-GAP repeat